MECERWGEDEEVAMDVDLSVEEELYLLSEITHTRDKLAVDATSNCSLAHSLAQAASPVGPSCYTVSLHQDPILLSCLPCLSAGETVSGVRHQCFGVTSLLPSRAQRLCY